MKLDRRRGAGGYFSVWCDAELFPLRLAHLLTHAMLPNLPHALIAQRLVQIVTHSKLRRTSGFSRAFIETRDFWPALSRACMLRMTLAFASWRLFSDSILLPMRITGVAPATLSSSGFEELFLLMTSFSSTTSASKKNWRKYFFAAVTL